ncbi:hypothetical protein [Mesorhizobium sp. PAMC28654]|nr:hypothetical protein [Mesorhizobium sp. PAMC28654]
MTHNSAKGFTHAAEQAQQWVNELTQDLGWNEQNGLLPVFRTPG